MLSVAISCFSIEAVAQKISVTATAGTLSTGYASLKAAFNAINAGTHQGIITVKINLSTNEGLTPATLNSSGAGLANYISVSITPSADGVSVSGNPGTGYGVIQLNGADNVTIDGDNPNTSGTNRNMSITNTSSGNLAYTSVIRIATSGAVTTANNITIKNCVLTGNATGKNLLSFGSVTGSENTTFGVYVGGNAGTVNTGAPTALNSVTANTSGPGETYNSLLIDNNAVNACARGIVINGIISANSSGVTISNNLLGDQVTNVSGIPPYTSPSTTVYTKGISIAGTGSVIVSGNSIKNIISYVPDAKTGIELNAAIGNGTILISGNTMNSIVQNLNTDTNKVAGIIIKNAAGVYAVTNNIVNNIQGWGGSVSSQTSGIFLSTAASSASVENNKVISVYNRNVNTWGVQGINLAAGNNLTIKNNFVSDINENYTGGSTLSPTFGATGIRIASGTGHKIYHNSVYLFGAALGNPGSNNVSAAFVIASLNQKNMEVKNNIFSNIMTGGTSSVAHVSVALPPAGSAAMNLAWNNNTYFCGTSATTQGIAKVGTTTGSGFYLASNFNAAATTPSTNLRAYTSILNASGTNDNASYASVNTAPFISSSNLHIDPSSPESINVDGKGANIGVTADIDGEARLVTSPDIGADEFELNTGIDMAVTGLASPGISSCHSAAETVVVTVRNASGGAIDFSINPITVTVNVSGQATAILSATLNTGSLAANASQNITVGQLDISSQGNYNFAYQVSVNAGTDIIPANNSGNTSVLTTPLSAIASASPASLCAGGSSVLSVTASGGNGIYSYLWDGGTNTTTAVNTTGTINASNNYNVTITDGCFSTVSTGTSVIVNDPLVLTTAPGTRCGAGTVLLGAAGSAGTTLNWYANSSNGSVIGTGTSFTSPSINNTTTYYVSAVSNVTTTNGGRISPATTNSTILTDAGLVFDATKPFTLNSVDVYPKSTTTTAFSIALVNSSGTVLFLSTEQKLPVAGGTTPYTVLLGWPVGTGTGYRLVITGDASGNLVRESSGFSPSFPYALGTEGSITGGWLSGGSAAYYFFYNWNISAGCESARIPVTATITTAPSIITTGSTTGICAGATATLTVSSLEDPNYSYIWKPGNLNGNSVSVAPTVQTTYTVNAVDNTGGVYAGCSTAGSVTVSVTPLPGAITISPSSLDVCASSNATLITASTGAPANPVILSQNFDGNVSSWTITKAGSSPLTSKWYYQAAPYTDDNGSAVFSGFTTLNGGKFAFSNADAGGQGSVTDTKLASPSFSTVGFASAILTFENAYRSWNDDVKVILEISTDGGSSWATLKDYKALGSQGITDDGLQTTTNDTISLASYLNKSNLKLRFNYKSNWGYYWIIDNVVVSGTPNTTSITWSPVAGLYLDASASTAYTGDARDTVFVKPVNASVYTALAANAQNCTSSKTLSVTVSPAPAVNAGINQTICYSSVVNLSGTIGGTATSAIWSSSGTGSFNNANSLTAIYTPSTQDKTNGSFVLTLTTNDPPGICTAASSSITITVNPIFTLNVVTGTIACRGGTTNITITATGGTPPYVGTGTFATGAGFFTHTVTDAAGCSRTVSGNIPQPAALVVSVIQDASIVCKGGTTTVTVSASGGTTPYTGTGVFTVPAGSYTYSVTDSNGCTKDASITVIEPATGVSASASAGNILCNGGTTTVTVTATGGTAPYTGTGTFAAGAGLYSYTVTDTNGCTSTATGNITEPPVLSASAMAGSISCNGDSATVTVTASGGVSPYTGAGTFTSAAGTYTYTVTDANGCSANTTAITITQPDAIIIGFSKTDVSCFGGADGSLKLIASNGNAPYTYSFDSGLSYQSSDTKTNLVAGNYATAIKDATGCVKINTALITVSQPALPVGGTFCYTSATKVLHIAGTGGTAPYKYSYDGVIYVLPNTQDGGRDVPNVNPGTYSAYVKDSKNCIFLQTINTNNLPACQLPVVVSNGGSTISKINKAEQVILDVNVHPNPSESYFTLTLHSNTNVPIQLRVLDMYGKVLFSAHGNVNDTYRFGDKFAQGAYMVHIVQGNHEKTLKIVKG